MLLKKLTENIYNLKGVANFLTSPLWTDFKRTFHTLFTSLWIRGWHETWKQFMDDLDPFGEHQALKVNATVYFMKYQTF
jgi:DnaJ family protein C protein 22